MSDWPRRSLSIVRKILPERWDKLLFDLDVLVLHLLLCLYLGWLMSEEHRRRSLGPVFLLPKVGQGGCLLPIDGSHLLIWTLWGLCMNRILNPRNQHNHKINIIDVRWF